MRSDGGQKKPAQKNPEGKKCGQEIWVGTKAQAQSPSYGPAITVNLHGNQLL